jgi:hypothetical protein
MINLPTQRFLGMPFGLYALAALLMFCVPTRAGAIERENFGNMFVEARIYLKPIRLPENSLPPEKQREFDRVWREVLASARDVQDQWAKACAKDDLLQRAIDGFQRAETLTEVYNDLRNQLRERVGSEKFNELESKFAPWLQARGEPWIDVHDTKLLRLDAWFIRQYLSAAGQEDVSWLGVDPKTFLKSDESQQVLMIKTSLQSLRTEKTPQVQLLNAELDSIPLMRRYLETRGESDDLHLLCEYYLRAKQPANVAEIATAEEKFFRLSQQAHDLQFDLRKTLFKARTGRVPNDAERHDLAIP